MSSYAVIQTGGKQYIVKKDDKIVVDRLEGKENETVELEPLATFDSETADITFETSAKKKVVATIVSHEKGDKIRVAKFKSKVRYRKVRGFRPSLTTLHIQSL